MPIVKEYYDNGVLKAKGLKQNGFKEGKWVFYFEDGKKFREIYFKNDVEHGEWKMWYSNGNVYLEQMNVLGKPEGYWKEYYENGNIKEIGVYRNGEYFPVDFWDESGCLLLKNGTGKKVEKFGYSESDIVEHYFENGRFVKEVKISTASYSKFAPKEKKSGR